MATPLDRVVSGRLAAAGFRYYDLALMQVRQWNATVTAKKGERDGKEPTQERVSEARRPRGPAKVRASR